MKKLAIVVTSVLFSAGWAFAGGPQHHHENDGHQHGSKHERGGLSRCPVCGLKGCPRWGQG